MDPGITPDGRSRDLHRGPKVWGMGSGVTPVHGTWSTAYAYAVPTACWYTHSAAAPQLVEMWSGGDPGSRRSWDRDEWDHDPGDIQMDEIPGGEILR